MNSPRPVKGAGLSPRLASEDSQHGVFGFQGDPVSTVIALARAKSNTVDVDSHIEVFNHSLLLHLHTALIHPCLRVYMSTVFGFAREITITVDTRSCRTLPAACRKRCRSSVSSAVAPWLCLR